MIYVMMIIYATKGPITCVTCSTSFSVVCSAYEKPFLYSSVVPLQIVIISAVR